jgi:hypothetical protein
VKDVSEKSNMAVIGGLYKSHISLKCLRRGHSLKLNFRKKLTSISCLECKRMEREEWKDQIRKEEQIKDKENEKK